MHTHLKPLLAAIGFALQLIVVLCAWAHAGDKVDPARARKSDGIRWYDVAALGVEGRGWDDTELFYDRLPARAKATVRPPVWTLSRHSAGMCVRFVTDATAIHARWELRSKHLAMLHMPATGVSGVDLYVKGSDARWNWLSVGRPKKFPANTERLVSGLPDGKREYRLYLPLYNGVTSVELGLPEKASLWKADAYPPARRNPIVFYGTSITQGASASRPGMVHTAILGRWFNHPAINLGFSGNGMMEPEMATLLAELDPAVYVLDCLPNMNAGLVKERVEPFVKTLREARPETPILLVEDRNYSNALFLPAVNARNTGNRAELRKAWHRLKKAGVKGLHYLPGNRLLGDDEDNWATVDGSHPTDLGFMRQAKSFREALRPILAPKPSPFLEREWERTEPDIVVYLPRGIQDGDNEHFLVFNNNPGKKGKFDQFGKNWKGNQLNFLRNPAFIAVGEFRKDAHQPVWFSEPRQLLDTGGLAFGPKGTASVAMYPSLTEHGGKRVLWYPDRKHFLLGKVLADELMESMNAP